MEGQKWTSFCPDQDACVLKEATYTQGLNSGDFLNDSMASDFSTHKLHAINDVCLQYVWVAKIFSSPVKKIVIYVQLNCFVALI